MESIKINGKLSSVTKEGVLAETNQLYDLILEKFQSVINQELINEDISIRGLITALNTELDGIVIDSLTSDDTTKALSAKQGKILKGLIDAVSGLQLVVIPEGEDLPTVGVEGTLYFKRRTGSELNISDEYLYVEDKWELIGSTNVDLTDYYTKSEIDAKLSDAGLGDVVAESAFTTLNNIIVAVGANKTVKDSGVNLNDLATKTYVDDQTVTWNEILEKPVVYPPSTHTHTVSQITDFPEQITVDSALNLVSENPVQNKVVTESLNEKVSSTVDLTSGKVVIGAGNKEVNVSETNLSDLALKTEIPSLSGYATQEWVNMTGNTWRTIRVGAATLSDKTTPLTFSAGTGVSLSFVNGNLTINGTIPTFQALTLIAGEDTISYNGTEVKNLNLNSYFTQKLKDSQFVSTPGEPGIYYTPTTDTIEIKDLVTIDHRDAIVIVPSTTVVTFENSSAFSFISGINDLTGGDWWIYCISLVHGTEGDSDRLVLVNVAPYGSI